MSIPVLGNLALSGRLEAPSSLVIGDQVLKNFGSSAVLGVLRGLVEMIAEFFRPLLCPLPRHAYLPLFYIFSVATGNVPEFPELRAGFCVQNGLHRFFDRLTTPVRPGLRLAHQDLVGHLVDASIFAHCALLFLAATFPQGEYNPARFLRANGPCYAAFKGADEIIEVSRKLQSRRVPIVSFRGAGVLRGSRPLCLASASSGHILEKQPGQAS